MKFFAVLIFSIIGVWTANATDIKMFGQDKYGYSQPKYEEPSWEEIKKMQGVKILEAIAVDKHFPFSSSEQGSIFTKIFEQTAEKAQVYILTYCDDNHYTDVVTEFERGHTESPNALFGVYYEEVPYSQNQFIYPAFFTNDVHVIFAKERKLDIKEKSNLKDYRGVHVTTDTISKTVKKEINSLGVKEVESFPQAFEELLTGKADYMVASYYPSLIELYKLGIRNYVAYSKTPIWKMPMFIKVDAKTRQDPRIKEFEKYLKSRSYKEKREKAFAELLEIYKRNTEGVVPPTYTNSFSQDKAEDTDK